MSEPGDANATTTHPSGAAHFPRAAVLSAPPASPPGYELLDEIGHGGMGVVYRARDTALDRDVAVKLLAERYPPDSPAAQRFLSEARITGQLQHPGIPAVHQVGTLADGRPFLAMKLIKGSTLDALLRQRPDPAADRGRLLAAFEAVCQAVGYAHAHRVIHRDLKPANVMVGAFGEVQVMDWGLAKVLGPEAPAPAEAPAAEQTWAWTAVSPTPESSSHTQAGSLVGTPAFIPPEQALGELEKVDERSDVFGLGALLAVILTGQPPYVGESFEAVRVQAVRGKLDDCFARLDASGAEPDLMALCKKCLAFEPADRPADAGAVAQAVAGLRAAADERARRAELERVRVEGEQATAAARAAERRKRRRLGIGAAAVLAVASLGGLTAVLAVQRRANADLATKNIELADEQTKTEAARVEAEGKRKAERWERYRANMIAAAGAMQLDNVVAAKGAIDAAPEEHRNWEWSYFHNQLDTARDVIHLGDDIAALEFSSDGRMLAVQAKNGPAGLWNLATRRQFAVLPHAASFFDFNHDNTRLAYRPHIDQKTVVLWDLTEGRERAVFRADDQVIDRPFFDPRGMRLAAGTLDRTVRVWDTATGKPLNVLRGIGYTVISRASFSSDNRRLLTAGPDHNFAARLWDLDTSKLLAVLGGHETDVLVARFNPAGDRIVTSETYPGNALRLWDGTGKPLAVLRGHTNGEICVNFSPDGTRIASGGLDQSVRLWDGRTGQAVSNRDGHRGAIGSVAFSPDSRFVLSASKDRTLRLWDAQTGAPVAVLLGHTGPLWKAQYSADGRTIISGSAADGTVRLWDARSAERSGFLRGHGDFVYDVAFHPDGQRVASASWDGTVRVWDATAGQELSRFSHPARAIVGAVAFHPAGKLVASFARDGALHFWDLATSREAFSLPVSGVSPDRTDPRIAFNPAGNLVAAPRDDTTALAIWDVDRRAEVATLRGHRNGINDVRFSPDGSWVASASLDASIRVWDARTWTPGALLEGHTDSVYALAVSRDGKWLASASVDGTVGLWDTRTWTRVAVLKHGTKVYGVAFTPDGTRLASACADNLIRLWDLSTFQLVAELNGHTRYVHQVAFSPDGTRLVSASGDFTVRVWDTLSVQERARRTKAGSK